MNKETEPEKNYHELIMLLTPWRNEETDLPGRCSSYQERYLLLCYAINEQVKHYAICNEDFTEIQQEMSRIEDTYDTIVPCTQYLVQQDVAEGNQDLHPDFNESYNLSDDLGIPSADLNTDTLLINELQDEYRHLVQMLNKEQKEFL